MTGETPEQDETFARNMAAFQAHFPIVHLRLLQIREPQSRITGSAETGDLNLDLGHTAFYTPDAVSFAETQLARFRAQPVRFYMNPPPLVDPPVHHHHHVSKALYEYGRNRKIAETPTAPVDQGGFLLVYGIGLGCHIPALFDEAKVRHFILIDEHIEFLWQSLHLYDWAGMFERLFERGQTLRFVFGPEPQTVAAQVHWYMRGQGFGLIDGSFLFRHYSSMMLDKAYQEFTESLSLLPISIGFFEDELIMLSNCGLNLIWFNYSLLDERPRVEIDLPAIIVGSGPSLDRSIAVLRELQGKAIVFSCGSALRPLLKAGIRPDFHCELENGWESFRSVLHVVDELGYVLDGITLIASTTVYPDLLPLFKQRILYFRDSVCSTALWCPDHTGIYGTAPTCTNLALRAATLLSFKELYLFGVDLGTRDPSQHHSKAAIYYNDDRWKGVLEADPPHQMSIELPANFGGKAYSSTVLHWTRMMMAQGIEAFSFSKIFNCSDGVTIPGTAPRLPSSIRVNAPLGRKQIILARINRSVESKSKREMVPLENLIAARQAFVDYYDRMLQTVDDAADRNISFIAFYEEMAEYLQERGESEFQITLRNVNIGTLMMSFQVAYYFVRRVPSEEQTAVMAVYLKALRERLLDMKAGVGRIFARVEAAHAEDRTIYTVNGRDYAI
jgi:Glycosyltransferase Maf N-terminal domain/6-hydroxymethylpterin diphosphokinase MptE-like